jgi:cell division protein FtsQ
MSIVAFDADAARARLEALPAIAEASVQKVYPSALQVTVTERLPIARWRVDGVTFAIDASGAQLAVLNGAGGDLPLVIGDGAADDAAAIISVLDRHPLLQRQLLAISRIADRRWDLIYDNGLRIMLPETGVEAAVDGVERLDSDHALLARDLQIIDLRVPGQLAVRPADRSEADERGDAG